MSEKTFAIATLGCKVNQYESEAITEALEKQGWELRNISEPCTAYIINTCTVTAESDRKARQTIRRAMSKNPEAFVLVTGCYSQTSPEAICNIAGVDYVCGTSNKMSLVKKLGELFAKGAKNEDPEVCVPSLDGAGFEYMSIERFDRTRAYVKIQDGCESRCTYCTIPAARGPVRSRATDDILREVRGLIERGCREVVLTGIETGYFGKDLSEGENLPLLLGKIDSIPGDFRVRLGSLDPSIIRADFVERIKDLKHLAPHFHLSMQSGSDKILAAMKRKYNSHQALEAMRMLRDALPTVSFTTDIIVGFPGESEENYLETEEFTEQARFLMVHVFPYSKRKGTPAAVMKDQIPENVKHERVLSLSRKVKTIRDGILDALVGSSVEVLFESQSGGYVFGHTPEFVEVKVKSSTNLHAQVRRVRIVSHDSDVCLGEII